MPRPIFCPTTALCLNASAQSWTDHSHCKLKSLPLLFQNGCRDKSQTFSFDRVQEITVYISSCITWVSKLSGFGGGGRGGCCASNTIWAGSYHCWLLWCRHQGSCLYHLCFARTQLFLFTALTSYLLMQRIFDVRREALHRGESLQHGWPQNLPPISLLEFKFKQLGWIVFVPLSPFYGCRASVLCCLPTLANENWEEYLN